MAAIVDRKNAEEAVIRAEVQSVCEQDALGGYFRPGSCLTYAGPGSIFFHGNPVISDQIEQFNLEYGKNTIKPV